MKRDKIRKNYKGSTMQKSFEEALEFRHACKIFDEDKKISQEDMHYILEAGRKAPSSFGMEAWKFLAITNTELKEKLRPACWNQPQITTCSHLVIILAGIESVKPQSGIPAQRFGRRDMPKEKFDFYLKLYEGHLQETLSSDENIYAWTARQTYLAAANMMNAAAIKGIDSCPIEGFDKKQVEEILGLDTSKYQLALVLPFGYRVNEQPTQLRVPFEEIVEFIE
jgi:nitroreductase